MSARGNKHASFSVNLLIFFSIGSLLNNFAIKNNNLLINKQQLVKKNTATKYK